MSSFGYCHVQQKMLQEILYSRPDTKLAKRNTNLQVNIYINSTKDIAGRDRTDNRAIEITYLNKSIF